MTSPPHVVRWLQAVRVVHQVWQELVDERGPQLLYVLGKDTSSRFGAWREEMTTIDRPVEHIFER